MDDPARDEEAGLPGNGGATRQRSSIPSFLFITFVLFMLTSHNGDEFLARHQYQDALHSLTYQRSNYTAWMNGTSQNYSVPDQDPSLAALLDIFNIKGNILPQEKESYSSNITGFIHASSHFHNITPSALQDNQSPPWNLAAKAYMSGANETQVFERLGSWNWTATKKLSFSVVEKLPMFSNGTLTSETIALVHGRIEVTDVNRDEDLRLEFEGVHFIFNGSIYGLAEPSGHSIDIRLLPSLVPSSAKNEIAQLIEPELTARINKVKNLIDAGVVDLDNSSEETPKSTCPFTFYAQIHPVSVPTYLMRQLEEEIQRPTGIWTIDTPKFSANGLLVSRECGLMFEVDETKGLRSRTFFRKVTTYAGSAGLAYLALLILFSRQTEHSRTPSGLGRVSRWLFLSQSTIDSVSFAGHITFAILAEGRPSLSLITPAFLACVLFIYEAQFSVLIHQIQLPEDSVPSVPLLSTPPRATSATSPSTMSPSPSAPAATTYPSSPAAPPYVTPTPAQPSPTPPPAPMARSEQLAFFAFFMHHVRTDPQARLWVTLFIFLTFIVRVILSPTLSMIFVSVTYSIIWLPQIVRSARRGRSSGLTKEYVVGTTMCRLYLAMYFLACPKNVLDVEPRSWSYLLVAFVCLQASIVLLQDSLGSAFFLPKRYITAKSYNYHPPLPLPDPEAPEQSLGDCAICMDAINVEPRARGFSDKEKSGERCDAGDEYETGLSLGSVGLFSAMGIDSAGARKVYSLAPCHHLFHTECLEKWLAIKNICPQCRRPLPSL